jgi:hypothetical protein
MSDSSSLLGSKAEKGNSIYGSSRLPALMRAGKELANEDNEIANALFGP